MTQRTIKIVRAKLKAGGFTGLYYPGECACLLDDLAPCGNSKRDDEGYINGCSPGHKHVDPNPCGHLEEWVVSASTEPPSEETFASYRGGR